MLWVSRIIRNRRHRRQKEKHNPAACQGLGFATLIGLLISLALVSSSMVYAHITDQIPSLDLLPLYFEPPDGLLLQPTQLLDRTGSHVILTLSNPASAGSQYLAADQLPEVVVQAMLASVDPSFWQNSGFSWKGLVQGTHPTLAQSLVSEFLLKDEPPGLTYNLRERLLAAQVTQRFGREKVLEWYLNTVEYGPLLYGIDAAAHAYFGKPTDELSLAEASALAALAEAPEINPLLAPQVLDDKRNRILQEMLIQGWITAQQALQAGQEKLEFQPAVEQNNLSLAFTNLVFDQLATQIPYEQLARGGFRIITTLDYDLQMQAVCASESLIARLQAQPGETTAPDGTPCLVARLISTPANPQEQPIIAEAAVIVLDPQTGQVLSLVGKPRIGAQTTPLEKHDPGSLLTPFLYLTAFTRGFSPGSLLWDLPLQTSAGSTASVTENNNYHGPVRLRIALANDYLGTAVQIQNQIGSDNILRTIHQFGFESDKEILLLEAVQAYGILAHQGIHSGQTINSQGRISNGLDIQPTTVLGVQDNQGKVWLDWSSPRSQPVLSPQLAYLVNHVLSDESARWASLGYPNPLEIGRPAGAKIGRTASQAEEWTVGYTPQRVVGVWMGSGIQNDKSLPRNASASLWHALLQYATRDLPAENWPIPPGVKTVKVCDPSGLIPTEYCPAIVAEVFLEGNEPNQPDNLYRKFQINRETGKLATVFTPPELVEERVFLSLPAEAVSWAQENGMPVPPDTYDTIYAPPEPSSTVQIVSPAIFEHVGGQIAFQGSAAGEGFQFYRLQVGKGLNPQEWIQVGQDSNQPVRNGSLGIWNTQGLSGLYAVQLLVVRADQRVDRFVMQVTVDNQPPRIVLLSPSAGQLVSASKTPSLLFQVEASDDLELERVHFYLDGILIASLSQAPFALPWQTPQAGKHELRTEAVDLAGNKSEAVIAFEVK